MDRKENKEKDFMTAKQVAIEFFNNEMGYQKVLRLTRNGKLPAVKIGKSYLYSRVQLIKWAEINFSKPACARIKVG